MYGIVKTILEVIIIMCGICFTLVGISQLSGALESFNPWSGSFALILGLLLIWAGISLNMGITHLTPRRK